MPRLPPQILRRAFNISPELRTLLPACRDLDSAKNELRWIRQHVDAANRHGKSRHRLLQLCHRRGQGEPLQYLLGSQPFGTLDIKCAPGVLIPRPETEAYVCHLLDLLRDGRLLGRPAASPEQLRIVDFCTGTGCIPLLLFAELQTVVKTLDIRGIDVSTKALDLAQSNVARNIQQGHMRPPTEEQCLNFTHADVFDDQSIQALGISAWDVLISNPPYIAEDVWHHGRGQLGLSVKRHEPRLALVPGKHLPQPPPGLHAEDIFYGRLLDVAETLQPKVILLEIGDRNQARRVIEYCAKHKFSAQARMEVWRDWPDLEPDEEDFRHFLISRKESKDVTVPIKGSGHVRCIVIKRDI